MAKKSGKLAPRSPRGIQKSRSGRSKPTVGILPVAGALGVVSILIANDYGGTGNSPVGWLQAGQLNNTLYALSKNLTTPTVLAALVPAVIILAILLWLHKHFGGRTRVGRRTALV